MKAPTESTTPTARAAGDAVLEIVGGTHLRGVVRIPGAKNAALPMIVAACLSPEPTVLENVPVELNDVRVLITLLRAAGAHVGERGPETLECSSGDWGDADLRGVEGAGTLRHSLLLLGAAASRGTALSLPLPGGCKLGSRKHDLHVHAFERLGIDVIETDDELSIAAGRPGEQNEIAFRYPTFGGTLNVLFAAATWPGSRTVLRNAARNPEVEEVIRLLRAMGASIAWHGPADLEIVGVERLHAARQAVMSDRIVAATLIAATVVTRGHVRVDGASLGVLSAEAAVWREAGIELGDDGTGVEVAVPDRLRATRIETAAYPGFHTDNQPLHAAMMCFADGRSEIRETILDGRFAYARELSLLGATTEVVDGGFTCVNGAPGQLLRIDGGHPLRGAHVNAPDIRGGGALVVAALAAEGTTVIGNLYQLERGYRGLPEMLDGLGAQAVRTRRGRPAA